MLTKSDTFISVDIETTGLDPQLNEIIEIGAVKLEEGRIIAEYSELVKPESPIPEFITHLTGITDDDVRSAGKINEVIPSFLDFIRGHRLIGQNVGFDVEFLRRAAGIGNIGTAVDNIELARILLPCLTSYSLDSLIDFFALKPGKRHRALDDARVTAEIFLKLIDMLRVVPVSFLNEMLAISSKTGSILVELFEAQVHERMNETRPIAERPLAGEIGHHERKDNIFGVLAYDEQDVSEQRTGKVDPDEIGKILADGGGLSAHYEAYEERSGQIAFGKKVAGAFNESEILLAEAGTGTGKSVAYLIPAIFWAESARERVIVSTNTKNLQEQLFYKDIPLIGRFLDFPFRAVILKGRGNYICLHRWKRLVEKPDRYLSKRERDLMLPLGAWLLNTVTGDLSETGFFSMLVESGLLERVNSDSVSCLGARCKNREKCFVNRIRKASQSAHIIIVNHSLVFSDMVSEGGVLGSYSRIVFDEAHNIEKVALQYLGVTLNYYRIRRILNRLYASENQGHGLFAVLAEWIGQISKAWPEFAASAATVNAVIEAVKHLRSVSRELFEHLFDAVRAEAAEKKADLEGKLRYDENTQVFSRCADTIEAFKEAVSYLYQGIEDIKVLVSGVSSGQLRDRNEILMDLEKTQSDLQEIINDFEFLIEARGRNVFWFEYNASGTSYSLRVHSAPLDVAEKLAAGLYDHMETVVMTSATLTVARDFSYIRERLGINLDSRERAGEFIAASPFDFRRQSVVVVPAFLPSPKHEKYIERTNEVLLTLAKKIRRGMLVLFTSRGHLYRSYHELRDELARHGITLLGQGIDGSRNQVLRRFREETSSVLFGTDSFWEGVDVPGNALEIVVIVRLPFAVPTEPIIQAQMEEIQRAGGRPFIEYSVPEAAIKLRQGAGRLIRHRSDRGSVIVFDTRIITAKYGQIFRKCLPGNIARAENSERMVEIVNGWFGEEGSHTV